jgi:hypothetical protein
MKVMKYLVIDYCLNFSFISNSKEELIESLGYELGEIEFEELCVRDKNEYEIIEVKDVNGLKWLSN